MIWKKHLSQIWSLHRVRELTQGQKTLLWKHDMTLCLVCLGNYNKLTAALYKTNSSLPYRSQEVRSLGSYNKLTWFYIIQTHLFPWGVSSMSKNQQSHVACWCLKGGNVFPFFSVLLLTPWNSLHFLVCGNCFNCLLIASKPSTNMKVSLDLAYTPDLVRSVLINC